jgi:hypothetical protein
MWRHRQGERDSSQQNKNENECLPALAIRATVLPNENS